MLFGADAPFHLLRAPGAVRIKRGTDELQQSVVTRLTDTNSVKLALVLGVMGLRGRADAHHVQHAARRAERGPDRKPERLPLSPVKQVVAPAHLHVGIVVERGEQRTIPRGHLIHATLAEGADVKLSGFGNFTIRRKAPRPGRNPRTGEAIPIAARNVVTFHASSKLKGVVQGDIPAGGEFE